MSDATIIKQHRRAMGMTQQAFAKELGYSTSTVSRIETGRYPISAHIRKRLIELDKEAAKPLPAEDRFAAAVGDILTNSGFNNLVLFTTSKQLQSDCLKC